MTKRRKRPPRPKTTREVVLEMKADAWTVDEIAQYLGITRNTVWYHLREARR